MSRVEHSDLISRQFGPRAQDYVASSVHAQGEDLAELADLARSLESPRALDIGCGGGHATYAVAAHAGAVTAYDMSPEMLAAVKEEASRRGLKNVQTERGPAEQLPFAEASFDLVVTRFSAHHWRDVPRALAEAGRVLKPSGGIVVIDVVAAENPLLDTFLQTVEMLRDPSHVRDYSVSEWTSMLERAGFAPGAPKRRRLTIGFDAWIARMRTPPVYVEAIRKLQADMPDEVSRYFGIAPDGSFFLDAATMPATVRA